MPWSRNSISTHASRLFLPVVALAFSAATAFASDIVVDGVPIPENARVSTPAQSASQSHLRFAGAWVGAWEGAVRHVLIVESVRPNGEANVIYAVGDNPWAKTARAWHRHRATITGDVLRITTTFTATYMLESEDSLRGIWQRGENRALAMMSKIDLASLLRGASDIPWMSNVEFVMLDTDLHEGGKAVRLEAVLYKPEGGGPFPLFVFNHGSTGTGREPKRFRETWASFTLANTFIAKGWMVAFPQRRGRGNSDGLYDEGFASDRRQGYACDAVRSLHGVDRALEDIEAAVAALQRRADVSASSILIGGQSRGGVLSLLYAAQHPEEVQGVINFVGGWLGEACPLAAQVNRTLFRRSGRYGHPTLWIYGQEDSFYTIEHSRTNFAAFRAAGGRGAFVEDKIPHGGNGHRIIGWPQLWADPIEDYLRTLEGASNR